MKADLHIHTNFSDGVSSPQEVVRAAIEKNIDCICITDHREIKGAIEAMRFGFDKNILVLPGIEIATKLGDILGINIKEIIPDGLSVKETIEEIRKQGGIAVIAHPFSWPLHRFRGGKEDFLAADAIEIFNASLLNIFNKKAFNFSQEYNLPFTAGSDAHRAEFVGRAYIEVPQNILTEKELLTTICEKKIKVKGKNLNIREIPRNGLNKRTVFFLRGFYSHTK